jgi:uracil-DNA glycosylase
VLSCGEANPPPRECLLTGARHDYNLRMDRMEPLSNEARALLAWYVAMGADEAVGDTPIDWATLKLRPVRAIAETQAANPVQASRPHTSRPAPAAPLDGPPPKDEPPPYDDFDQPYVRPAVSAGRPQATTSASPARAVAPASDEAVMAARAQAGKAVSLDELRTLLQSFEGCGLKATAKSLCFYRGAARARVMVIGEAPGRDEDIEGKPFVGQAGQLLDKMLAAIGLDEASVHITNVVYWRPPGNRTPTPLETLICQPFLERQIELVAPEILLCVGGAAAKQVLDTPEGIMRLRGKWRDVASGERAIRAMATLHPDYLLRTPAAKRMAWRDLMAVKDALDGKA